MFLNNFHNRSEKGVSRPMNKVCMFVFNSCEYDSRVFKEAKTLTISGYLVKILALHRSKTKSIEKRDGFVIKRVKIYPLDLRLIHFMKRFFHDLNQAHLMLKNYIRDMLDNGIQKIKSMIYKESKLKSYYKKNIPNAHVFLKSLIITLRDISPPHTQRKVLQGINGLLRKHPFQFLIFGWIPFLSYLSSLYVLTGLKYFSQAIYETLKFLYIYFSDYLRTSHLFFGYLDYYRKCLKIVTDDPSDIYHAHDFNTLFLGYLAKRKTKGKLIYDSHELYAERNRPKKQSWLMKQAIVRSESFLIKRADYTITVCESIAKELRKRSGVKRIGVVMNVPISQKSGEKRSLREELNIALDKKIVLYIGSITFNRGLEELIKSLNFIDDCVLVLMGYSQNHLYFQHLTDLVQSNGVSHRVHFFGPVPSGKVIDYAASADIGAAPIKNIGLSYFYCLPNKLFEYLAAGIPVAGSEFPELKKIINGFKVGNTFDPDDPGQIAESIKSVLSDNKKYKKMKAHALQAARIFNWQCESVKLISTYNKVEKENI